MIYIIGLLLTFGTGSQISQTAWLSVSLATESTSFNIQTDDYCFCNLKVKVADTNCCCDPDNTNTTDNSNCQLGSVKKSCIKKYIISKQNVDQWVQVEENDKEICFIYEKSSQSTTSVILPQALKDSTYLMDYILNVNIPNTKYSKSDSTFVSISLFQTADSNNNRIYYPDSNGICRQIEPLTNYKQISKQECLMISCLSTPPSITTSGVQTPSTYLWSGSSYATSSTQSGCVTGQSFFMGYQSFNATKIFQPEIYTYFKTTVTTLFTYFNQAIYANIDTNSNYQGQPGYVYGQYIQGYIGSTTTPFGFNVYKGKTSDSDATCSNSDNSDPLNYDPLQFGQSLQYSCSISLNSSTAATLSWTSLQIFKSFPSGQSIGLARTPLYQESSSDFKIAEETTILSTQIPLTQQILIFYDHFGSIEARQNYIKQIKIIYPKIMNLSDFSSTTLTYYLNVKVKFINLAYSEVENDLPQDPPFIPQLPPDIFFPVWYETYEPILTIIFVILMI